MRVRVWARVGARARARARVRTRIRVRVRVRSGVRVREREGDRERKPGAHALVEPIAHMWRARKPVCDSKLGGIEGGEEVGCGE